MFLALVDENNPNVIGGSESHLDQSFFTPEIFPDYYNVFRKDHTMGGGGVFLCIKEGLNVVEEPLLDAEAELIWVKITLLNRCPIHVCIFYRPSNTDSYPIEQLRISITNLLNQSNSPPNVLLIGDFNFPGISWSSGYGQISAPTYGSGLNNLFIDVINDAGLEQFVQFPTHQNSVLDFGGISKLILVRLTS